MEERGTVRKKKKKKKKNDGEEKGSGVKVGDEYPHQPAASQLMN